MAKQLELTWACKACYCTDVLYRVKIQLCNVTAQQHSDNYYDKRIIDSVGLFVLFFSFKYKKRVMELVCKMHVHAAIFINS